MSKKKKCKHNLYVREIYDFVNYDFVVIRVHCAEEDCDFEGWEAGGACEH